MEHLQQDQLEFTAKMLHDDRKYNTDMYNYFMNKVNTLHAVKNSIRRLPPVDNNWTDTELSDNIWKAITEFHVLMMNPALNNSTILNMFSEDISK